LHQKFPQFETDDSYVGLYQPEAGLIDAALANSVHIQLARGNGANIIDNCSVLRIDKSANGRNLVITAIVTKGCTRIVKYQKFLYFGVLIYVKYNSYKYFNNL